MYFIYLYPNPVLQKYYNTSCCNNRYEKCGFFINKSYKVVDLDVIVLYITVYSNSFKQDKDFIG